MYDSTRWKVTDDYSRKERIKMHGSSKVKKTKEVVDLDSDFHRYEIVEVRLRVTDISLEKISWVISQTSTPPPLLFEKKKLGLIMPVVK